MTSVKIFHVIFKKFLLLFWKFLCYLVCMESFKSINGSSLSRKKIDENNSTPTSRMRLRGQNTSVGIKLIEVTEPSDASHYLKITFNKLFYTYFCFYIYVEQNHLS